MTSGLSTLLLGASLWGEAGRSGKAPRGSSNHGTDKKKKKKRKIALASKKRNRNQ